MLALGNGRSSIVTIGRHLARGGQILGSTLQIVIGLTWMSFCQTLLGHIQLTVVVLHVWIPGERVIVMLCLVIRLISGLIILGGVK